jgi:iron complex outermembrane recepter protein
MFTTTRGRLKASTIIIGAAFFAAPLSAQTTTEATAAAGEATATESTIVVTGSRIASPTITSVSPVQVVGAEQIDQSGVTNIQELLLENPAFGTPALSRTNSNFLTSGTGVATVDLRDLGSDRTLVLINGRRVVAGLAGSATVDLNVIPSQFLQRVDVLTGGASSLYGSDAVAGVVNFIYKDGFEGLEANAQYNITERGDTPGYQANLTFGGNFAEDRGNLMVHFGYSKEGQLASRERRNTRVDEGDRLFTLFTGDPADYGVGIEPFFSSFPPQGRFGAGPYTFTYSPSGVLQPCFTTNGASCTSFVAPTADDPTTPEDETDPGVPNIGGGVGPNGFNRQAFRLIAVPVQRYLFATRGHFDVTDNIRLIGEGTYSSTRSSRILEPFALDTGGANPLYPGTGVSPIETRVPVAGTNTFSIVRNPLVPDAIFNAATDTDGDGLRDVNFARRLSDLGTRSGSTTRDFYRFVVGLEGDVFTNFRWDLSYNFGRTKETQTGSGQPNFPNLRQALAVIPGPNGPVCADPAAAASGCVPVNFFGFNSVNPAAIPYISADQTLSTRITQQVVSGNLSGSLFELPAGPLGIAVGFEYRKEASVEDNDALTNAGLNGSNALPDTRGSFDVKEIYGEINLPILADKPFFNRLNLRAAGRVSDYSTVGTVYSYSGGIEWSPVEDIRLSGTYSRAVRAPNIGELFTGPSQTFPTGIADPCTGITAATTGTTATVCRQDPGVLANIAANGEFTVTQADLQGISGFDSGNPNLREEKSDSYTASLVVTPRSIDILRNTVLRVDYFNIDIDDAIVNLPRTTILDECYNRGNQDLCQFVTRYPSQLGSSSAGAIQFINSGGVNSGKLKAEGIDVTLTNRFDLAGLGLPGAINARVAYTHLFKNYLIALEGTPKDHSAGEIGTAKDRFTAFVGYSDDTINWNFTGTYIGRSCEDDATLSAFFDLPRCAIKVGAEFYLDTQATFKAGDNFEFYVGVDNLLDNDAPLILTNTTFNTTGTDTAADVYDVFGRRYYAGARLRF